MVSLRNGSRSSSGAGAGARRAGGGGRFKAARAREVCGLPNPPMAAKYADAVREMIEAEVGLRPKVALKRIRAKFCTGGGGGVANEPADWPGDHKMLVKIAFVKAALAKRK